MKTFKLSILKISTPKGGNSNYAVITAPSKTNPFGESGVCQFSPKHMQKLAEDCNEASIKGLILLASKGGASLSGAIVGSHSKGDLVKDRDGKTIAVPANQQTDDNCDSDGNQVYRKDGFNFDPIGYSITLSDKATDAQYFASQRIAAEAVVATVAEFVEETEEESVRIN